MPLKSHILVSLMLFTAIFSYGQNTDHEAGIYRFIPNEGQWPEGVNYKANTSAGIIWLEEKGILYEFQDFTNLKEKHHGHGEGLPAELKVDLLYMEFVGANENVSTKEQYPTSEHYTFFKGNDKSKWASKLHGYSHITYEELYPGADLLILEKDQELKYEFHLKPGSNPANISLKYKGQQKIKLSKDGSLVLKTNLGELVEQKPYAYQVKNGRIVEIPCSFKLDDNIVSYELGEYDHSLQLVIDPVLIFATYAGSVTDNFGMTATYAYDGKAYSAGITFGSDYPTPGPAWNTVATIPEINTQANQAVQYGVTDVFVSKYSADGMQMLWTCFLGGGTNLDGTETVHSLICDTLNNIYLYGATSSQDFPLMNEYQSTHGGGIAGANFTGNGTYFLNNGTDIWVSKLSSDGTILMGSTYVGGDGNDGLNNNVLQNNDSLTFNYGDQFRGEIMLDSMNNILVASCSNSSNFPTANSFQSTPVGGQDGVVFKLSADFSTLMWSTYYGGTNNDACYSVKLDSSYNVIIAGGTSSIDIPSTAGALTTTYQGGEADGFVAKITPDGSTLVRSSYIGTTTYDQAFFIEVDRWDNIYLYGQSDGNMPVINAPYSDANSGQFIMKLIPDLSAIDYSTVFGSGNGSIDISPAAFLVDVCGNAYCTGWAGITLPGMNNMPITTDAFQPTTANGNDFFLFVLERDAQSQLYGSYIGGGVSGEHVDGGTSRFDKFGIVYQSVCGGCGGNSDFPTSAGAWSATNDAGNCNNLVFKFDFEIVPDADFEISDIEGCAPFTFILDNESNDTINSVWTFPPEAIILTGGINPEIMFETPGQYEIIISITDTICNLQDTAVKIINVYDSLDLQVITNDTVLCNASPVQIIGNSDGTVTDFQWYDDAGLTNQINGGGLDSSITVNPTQTTTYYLLGSNGWALCEKLDSVTIFLADGAMDVDLGDSICAGDTTLVTAHNLLPSETMTFDWYPNSVIVSEQDSTALVNPPTSMWIYVTGTTGSGCVFTDSVWITSTYIDPNSVYATATPDSIPQGGTTVLEAFPNNSSWLYFWFPQNNLSSVTGQTVTSSGLQSDFVYEVTIYGNGCEVKTQVPITVLEFVCGDIYIFVPNAFTPNQDGENDILYVRGQNLTEVDLKIFDRWGELVFETTDQSQGWDGTFKGRPADPDVYVYHLTAICVDGQEALIKGNISLLR